MSMYAAQIVHGVFLYHSCIDLQSMDKCVCLENTLMVFISGS